MYYHTGQKLPKEEKFISANGSQELLFIMAKRTRISIWTLNELATVSLTE